MIYLFECVIGTSEVSGECVKPRDPSSRQCLGQTVTLSVVSKYIQCTFLNPSYPCITETCNYEYQVNEHFPLPALLRRTKSSLGTFIDILCFGIILRPLYTALDFIRNVSHLRLTIILKITYNYTHLHVFQAIVLYLC